MQRPALPSATLADVLSPVSDDLARVEALFRETCESQHPLVREMVHHFAYTIEREGQRIDGLLKRQLNDDLPMGPGMLPPGEIPPYSEVMREYRETTASFFAMLDGIDDAYNIDVQSRNNVIGPLNWKEWIAWMLRHANDHVEQAENIRSDPAFPS